MPTHRKSPAEQSRPWTRRDEDNLLYEIAEDQRLRQLGIDPDGDSVDIMMELDRLAKSYRHKRERMLASRASQGS